MLYSTYSFLTHVGFIIHAHNIYLDLWIEQGIVGLLSLLWMWGIFAVALWRESYQGSIRPYFAAAGLSLVTIALHGLVEDALYGSRALMLLFLPLAFAIPVPERRKVAAPQWRWLTQGIGLALLVVVAILWFRPLQSAAISNMAAVRQSQLELGLYNWPEWPIQDAVRREIDLQPAISRFEKALDIHPNNAAANRRLGQIALSLGEYEAALRHLERAYNSTPWDHASQLLYGEALITNNRIAEGADLWAAVSNAQGQLQGRAYWYEFIGDQERLEQINLAIKQQ
jgi:tetratricopeptide (TPR) repeat protein